MDPPIRAAEVVLPCRELSATLAFFTETLGFQIDAVFPADDPAVAVISGHGVRLRLDRDADGSPGALRLACDDPAAVARALRPACDDPAAVARGAREPCSDIEGLAARELRAPNGTRIELVPADPPLVLPPLRPSFAVTRAGRDARWVEGRAGMRYRDLIPDRQGGRFIASHIQIRDAGPVPDYVHWHAIQFQMIYCRRGWVRVVYDGQGEPFVLRAGDCVLQPPRIRHRVLEASAGLEVVEVSCPASHRTVADHELALPTDDDPDRVWSGQRFVRHRAATATWRPWCVPGLESRDTGIAAATGGLASAHVVRVSDSPPSQRYRHDAELWFVFVLAGGVTLACEGHGAHVLGPADAAVVPAGCSYAVAECAPDLELLAVALPGFDSTRPAD